MAYCSFCGMAKPEDSAHLCTAEVVSFLRGSSQASA
jgi:hypothetical protein